MHMTGRVIGLDRDHATLLFSAMSGLIATFPAKAAATEGKAPLTPAERAALRQLIQALQGLFTSVQAEETIEGLHVAIANTGEATIRRFRFGLGGEAPQGLLHTWLDIGLDGLAVADLPPEMAALIPRHVAVRPSLSGVSASGLTRLARDATEPDADPAHLEAEAAALFMQGGITVGLDSLAFDVGPAELQGTGQMQIVGPMDYEGHAHLTATGLDALIDRAHGDPTLQQAIPALIMLRGFARPEGDHLVWNVVASRGSVMVNGVAVMQPPDAHRPHGGPREGRQPRSR